MHQNCAPALFLQGSLRTGVPGEFLGENLAGRIGFDFGMDAQAGAGVAVVGEGAQDDMESIASFFDGGLRESSDLEEVAGKDGVGGGVEGGGGLGLGGGARGNRG